MPLRLPLLACLVPWALVCLSACKNPLGGQSTGDAIEILLITHSSCVGQGPCDIGSYTMGTSNALSFTVTNQSNRDVTLKGAAILPDFYRRTGGTCADTVLLESGASCEVEVAFEPTSAIAYPGTITQDYVYLERKTASRAITGLGLTPASLAITGTTDFGTRVIGQGVLEHTYTVTNSGQSYGRIDSSSGLAAPVNFTGGAFSGGGTCGSLPALVAPNGGTCTIKIGFTPAVSGSFPKTFAISYFNGKDSGLSATIALTAVAQNPGVLTISESEPYDYGYKYKDTSSTNKVFTLTYASGEANVSVTSLSGLAAPYTINGGAWPGTGGNCGALPLTLGPSGSCTFEINFSPTTTGTLADTMNVNFARWSGDSTSVSRGVTGEGVAAGMLNVNFSSDGKLTSDISGASRVDKANAVAVQTDNKIIVAGYTVNGSGNKDFALARYTTAAALDTTFDTDGIVTLDFTTGLDDEVNAILIQGDGSILAIGYSGTTFAVARFLSNGTLDTSYDTDGKQTVTWGGTDVAYGAVLDSNGKAVVVGSSISAGNADTTIARLNTDGSMDTTFDTDGRVLFSAVGGDDEVRAVGLRSDGKIIGAGYVEGGATGNDFYVFRLAADGTLETSVTFDFGNNGNEIARAIYVDTANSDRMVIAGRAPTGAGSDADFGVIRLTSAMALDTTFSGDGKQTISFSANDDIAYGISVNGSGAITLVGSANSAGGTDSTFALARLTTAGVLDTAFDSDGKSTSDFTSGLDPAHGVATQADGSLLVAGTSNDVDFALAKYWP